MQVAELDAGGDEALEQVLGYLNFSSGSFDPQFMTNLNRLFADLSAADTSEQTPTWKRFRELVQEKLGALKETPGAFQDAAQAESAVGLVLDHVLPGYRHFHQDLLFQQDEEILFGAFFVGRAFEAVLRIGPAADPQQWPEQTAGVITRLNDFIGHRPVATLESQKIEAYPNERVRPVPLYIRGSGVCTGPYQQVLEQALGLLEETDEDLLRQAYFDPECLEELALDPRAYDFDHPVNKRPNYQFGQWDPHHIGPRGFYHRFVVQQITIDALMHRVHSTEDVETDELLFEAAAVLAGTILMASGVSGSGPESHDSTVTLSTLLPQIAAYRDEFYERLIQQACGRHGERLRSEAEVRRQPFGGARQHLNARLARQRASQLEHVQLARTFAQMGHLDAATRQANIVPVASARMECQIDCWLSAGNLALDNSDLDEAMSKAPQIIDLLQRGIECGAIIDPWNILGFDAYFSLFPATENSVHDHRADELVAQMERVLAFYARIWSEAAAVDNQPMCQRIDRQFEQTATWWQQFATHEVTSVDAVDAQERYRAAQQVVGALNLWHKGGAATGDVGFWANHAGLFDSTKAYGLVIEALLQKRDFVSSMALLIHWLSQSDHVPLEQSDCSYHELAEQWMLDLNCHYDGNAWELVRKCFDYLEANADRYWDAPEFRLTDRQPAQSQAAAQEDGDGEEEDLYGAAYEDMVYRDSTDDGIEGEVFENNDTNHHDEFARESRRIADRLAFLSTLARLWKLAAVCPSLSRGKQDDDQDPVAAMQQWCHRAAINRLQLIQLLNDVRLHRIPAPAGDHESMLDYDRHRVVKETLLERIVATIVEMADAGHFLMAAIKADGAEVPEHLLESMDLDSDELPTVDVFAGMLAGDAAVVDQHWAKLVEELEQHTLLYVPLSKGGNPSQSVRARMRQKRIQALLAWLPRIGSITKTCQLIEISREMERRHPVGAGAVTEFDELFRIGYKAVVEGLVFASNAWPETKDSDGKLMTAQSALVLLLEQFTESLLISWLAHSRTLRLSVLEKVSDDEDWQRLVDFIRKYGADLFTQQFLSLGNVRAILHQGVDNWLAKLNEEGQYEFRLLDDLQNGFSNDEAVSLLSLILEAIVENYSEYRDYNSTTTQSDHGDLLYALLDFLRLRAEYDRICWKLKPVVLAHEILVRRGQDGAARLWRRAMKERTGKEANQYLERLSALQEQHAMRMPTVADRLAERFVRPLAIDRIRALVSPAIEEARSNGPRPNFEVLEHETESLTRQPTGVGLDIPAWLLALSEEVRHACRPVHKQDYDAVVNSSIAPSTIPLEDARQQLDHWSQSQGGRQ